MGVVRLIRQQVILLKSKVRVLSNRIESYVCIVGLIFLVDIALYTFIPDLIHISKEIQLSFWYANFTILFLSLGIMLTSLLIGARARYLMINLNVFITIIGIFQQLTIYGVEFPSVVWCGFAPLYILVTITIFKYVRN